MNGTHVTLNNQRHFVFAATLAAALLLLTGSANAQYLTVRCVPTTNPNPSCAKYYHTISAAVGAAVSGDIILVGPGIYPEYVTIGTGKDSLSIFGAQAGKDAREDRHDPAKESIVDASTTGGHPTFYITVPYVVIDGFTIKGGSGSTYPAGIYMEGSQGLQVLNNIIKDNGAGVVLVGGGGDVVERNLIKDNNAGSVDGYGVLAGSSTALGINDNEFSGNHAVAIAIVQAEFATITNNTSENDGSFVVFIATLGGLFKHNRGRNFGAKVVLPVEVTDPPGTDADAAVDIGSGNIALEISDNDLEEGDGSISNGIAFSTAFGSSYESYTDSEDVLVKNNRIKGFKCNGI